MKTVVMRNMVLAGAAIMVFAFISAEKLVGRWESQPSAKGNVTGVVFKADGTLEGYVNKKPFVSGTYSFKDDVISFTDNGCKGALAVYKTIFFSNEDSLRFEVISDSCTDRRDGMSRLVVGRVKN
jgi:hypothetical protein